MSGSSLVKLIVNQLRGSIGSFELLFEKNKKLTVIYGENGSGKSTISDALEFLSKGRVGSLDNRGLGKTNRYWNAVGSTPADVSVTLETATASYCAKIYKSEVVVQPSGTRPRVEVLRRSQILNLVEAQPGQRYTSISRFIDVSGVEASEQTLRKLISSLDENRNTAATRILENLGTIEQFWDAAGNPGTDAMSWAQAEASRDPYAADPELEALRALHAIYNRLCSYPQSLSEAAQTVNLARSVAEDAQHKVDVVLTNMAEDAGHIVSLLQSAQAYLHVHPNIDVCPLCERAEAAGGLSERIDERLSAFKTLQMSQSMVRKRSDDLRRAEQDYQLIRRRMNQDIAAFEQMRAQFNWSPDIRMPATPAPQEPNALAKWFADTTDLQANWDQAEAARQDQRQFIATLKSALQTYAENMVGQQELDLLLPNLKRTLEIVVEERKAFTDSILRKIATEVGRMYEMVHPGEGLNKISLELDNHRRASLDIGTNFGNLTRMPPQAYFSQSHLDTLGLCVFLALATLDDPDNTILVLDDVLASVDEPHVDRLIHMLYDEALKFRHCIITTHYGPWRHKLRWGWLKNNQCHFVELSQWSQTDGITIIRSVPEVERLRALLVESPPDLQMVCAKAGVILEAALDFLTQLYECSVPRKQGNLYTLGDLLPAVDKKLRKALRVDVRIGADPNGAPIYQAVELLPILDELHQIMHARNVFGCHFNAIAFNLLDYDALRFGQRVLDLIEALADPDAGWPRNDKSGMYWANAGETRRLHPLRRPG